MIDVGFKGTGIATNKSRDMTPDEAILCVQRINAGMNETRRLLLDLYERKGWKALGYASWRDCAVKEFGESTSRLYQQLKAAQIEREISTIVEIKTGTIPEVQLRGLDIPVVKQAIAELHYERHEDSAEATRAPEKTVARPHSPLPAVARQLIEKAHEIKKTLKPERTEKPRVNWSRHARSATNDEAQIIKWLLGLYNGGAGVDLDPTYSEGRVWNGLPKPIRRGDICPHVEGCEQMDARDLPYPASLLDSIFFDPPFVPKNVNRPNGKLGIIETRFSGYSSMLDLWQMYADSFKEFYRVLAPGGLLLVKNMDQISGGKFYSAFDGVVTQARDEGFKLIYITVLYSDNPPLMSPNMAHQQNPRHNHCYYFVLRKP